MGRDRASPLSLAVLSLAACGRIGFEADVMAGESDANAAPREDLVEAEVPGPFLVSSTEYTAVPGAELVFTPESESQVWLVLLSARLSHEGSASEVTGARYLVNGVERGMGEVGTNDSLSSGPWQHFTAVTGTTATQTVTLELRAPNQNEQGVVEDVAMLAFPLAPGADPHYAEEPGIQFVEPGVWATYHDLSFAPERSGTYLVVAATSAHEPPSSATLGLRLVGPHGGLWPEKSGGDARRGYFENGRRAWAPFLLARAVELQGAAISVGWQAQGATEGAEIRDPRILAFRADAFAGYHRAEDLAPVETSELAPAVKSSLAVPASDQARDHVVLQGLVAEAPESPTEARRIEFAAGGAVRVGFDHVWENPEFTGSYAAFDGVRTSGELMLENRYATSATSHPVTVKESAIHVLLLP